MAIATQQADMQYSLRGLNLVTPDQLIDDSEKTKGQSPYLSNSRMFAPETTGDPRSSQESRNGAGFYTIPAGETLDTQNTTTTGQSNQDISYLNRVAQQFTPTQNNMRLTAIELLLKSNTSNDTILIEIYENIAGNLGTRIGRTTISNSDLTASYAYVKARFIQAPLLSTSSSYWVVVGAMEQELTGTFHLSRTTTGSNLMTSVDGGLIFTATTGSINFKTYLALDGPVKGQCRFVTKTGITQTIFAHGDSIYRVTNPATGAITAIKTGLSTVADRVRFKTILDKLYIVNGYDAMQKWDGTSMTESTHTGDFKVPILITMHKNRAFYVNKDDPTRLYFSNIYPDLETVDSTNFVYVPDPASPDPITSLNSFQDQLVITTRESKWLLVGGDLASFSLNQSPGGTKGAVSQEATAIGETRLYFYSLDDGPCYYDGSRDVILGDSIQPETNNIIDHDTIDMSVSDREMRIYYKRVGDTGHSRMLLLDLRYREWFMDTETYTRLPVYWGLEDNELVEASSVVGALYFGETDLTHLGNPIDWKYWTNYKKYTSGIAKDRVKKFRAIFDSPDRNVTVQVGKDSDFDNDARYKDVILTASGVLYDGGETYDSPTALYGKGSRISSPKVSLSGRAMNTQYRFEKLCANVKIRLYGYEGVVKSGRMR